MNWGLNEFQTDYHLARETFLSPLKTPIALVPCQTNPVMQLLSDLSCSGGWNGINANLTSNFYFTWAPAH